MPSALRRSTAGPDDGQILVTECAFLSRMRVEAGDGEARMGDAETVAKIAGDDPAGLHHQIRGELRNHIPQREDGW